MYCVPAGTNIMITIAVNRIGTEKVRTSDMQLKINRVETAYRTTQSVIINRLDLSEIKSLSKKNLEYLWCS